VTEPEGEWTFLERPYATPNYSTFRGELQAIEELETTELWLVEEVFPHAKPKLVRDPILTMVTWTTDDIEKPFPLGREISFSFGPGLTLGAPGLVTDNLLPGPRLRLGAESGSDLGETPFASAPTANGARPYPRFARRARNSLC